MVNYCGNYTDPIFLNLPNLHPVSGIETFIAGGPADLEFKVRHIDAASRAYALEHTSSFPINYLFTYLKTVDSKCHPVTEFEPPLILLIKYSPAMWNKSSDPNLGYPGVAYLEWNEKNRDWAGDWIDLTNNPNRITVFQPGQHPIHPNYGFLCIEISTLPDPLIGGC